MSNGRMTRAELGGLTPSQNLKELDKLKKMIEIDPDITDDLEMIFRKRGKELPEILKKEPVFELKPRPLPFPFDPGKPMPLPTPEQPAPPAPEIDLELRLLLNRIPTAHPGNVITSDFHNSLRDALVALASRVGLDVNPSAQYKMLTFAPAFLPLFSQPAPGTTATAVNTNRWDVTLTRAAVTTLANIALPVSGGMAVQLPDGATIFQMIVRGSRLGKEQPAPKEFTVTLKRVKFGKDAASEVLIAMDLKSVKDGVFEAREAVKLTDAEANTANEAIAGLTIANRRVVDNEKWIYYVTADWLNGDPNGNSARFEINSIQIICKA